MHGRQRQALRVGREERMIELLEALAIELGADVEKKDQCMLCGTYYKGVSQHEPHCEGVM